MRSLLIFLSVLFVFIACRTNNNPIAPAPEPVEFPLTVGSVWEYVITDTIFYLPYGDSMVVNNRIMHVKIVDSTILKNGKKAVILQYDFTTKFDSLYAYRSGDTIYFQNKMEALPEFILIFPLNVGKEWERRSCDFYKVLSKDIVILPIGKISDVINVEQRYLCIGEVFITNYYFIKSDMGIVKFDTYYLNIRHPVKRRVVGSLNSYSIVS